MKKYGPRGPRPGPIMATPNALMKPESYYESIEAISNDKTKRDSFIHYPKSDTHLSLNVKLMPSLQY